jgi:hypothetical protein
LADERTLFVDIGRWAQPDPITFSAGDGNIERYVANDPTNAVDPTGLEGDTPPLFRRNTRSLSSFCCAQCHGSINPNSSFKNLTLGFSKVEEMSPVQQEMLGLTASGKEVTWRDAFEQAFSHSGPREPGSVGQPGTLESITPFWGSGRAAIDNFQNGEWGAAVFNGLMAVSDIVLVKSLVVGGVKLAVAGGGKLVVKETVVLSVKEATQTAPAKFVRFVRAGETIAGLVAEGKGSTWVNGTEYAVLSIKRAGSDAAERVIVSGGRDGIEFTLRTEEVGGKQVQKLIFEIERETIEVKRVIGHTHPRATGPSDGDLKALRILGQTRSYIFEIGGEAGGTLIRPK